MQLKKLITRNIYRWHRVTGMIIALPALLWTLSGFLHPVMSSFRPEIKNQTLPAVVIDTAKVKLPLNEALAMHGIDSFHNFRIVELYGGFYYQVQQNGQDSLSYISTFNGQLLPRGDHQYAAYMAQRYLSEPGDGSKQGHHNLRADLSSAVAKPISIGAHRKTRITNVELIKKFSHEYRSSNVLLPVYRVDFDRPDHLRLYIETSTGRMSIAMDDKRAWFTRFFAATHSWSFLDGMGMAKNILLGSISLLCFLSSVSGFYVYNIINRKKQKSDKHKSTRSWHRKLGNVFVLTTLLFAFSGAWHSFHKLPEKKESGFYTYSQFTSKNCSLPLTGICNSIDTAKLANISIVRMNGVSYWQVTEIRGRKMQKRYFETETLMELNEGDNKYGCYLACSFANKNQDEIKKSQSLNSFNNRYSMMKKRLPVIEVEFAHGTNYYVETSTGMLSAISGRADEAERFSFSNLHMQHYWEDLFGRKTGKQLKNIVLMGSTLGLMLLAFTGCVMYRSRLVKKRKAQQTNNA
jgi:hypothetical protein